MKKNVLFLVFIGFFLSMAPLAFASDLKMLTPADTGTNGYYVSNYSTREINFNMSYDFKTDDLKEGKIAYSYKVLQDSKDLDIQLSNTEVFFVNNFSSTEIIYLNTKQLTEIKNLQVKAEVFDNYNNLLSTKILFLKIIPNNSNNYYEYTKTHAEPRYSGYSMSRSIAVINGSKDYDVISIYTKIEDDSSLAMSCSTNNEAIVVEQKYLSPDKTDLKLTIDPKAKALESGDYFIFCKLYNAYVSQELPEIKLRYTSDVYKEVKKEQNQTTTITEKPKSATGFLSFAKTKSSSSTFILLGVLLVLILLIINSKNGS